MVNPETSIQSQENAVVQLDEETPACPASAGRKGWKILPQIGTVLCVCLLAQGIAALLPVPFPASVIGMVLLFLLLLSKAIRPHHLQEKAGFLVENMAFFFIPVGVEIMQYFHLLKDSWLPFLAVCLLTTVITFAATAFTVRGVAALQEHLSARRAGNAAVSPTSEIAAGEEGDGDA